MPSVLPFKHQPHKTAKDTQTIRLQESTILCGWRLKGWLGTNWTHGSNGDYLQPYQAFL